MYTRTDTQIIVDNLLFLRSIVSSTHRERESFLKEKAWQRATRYSASGRVDCSCVRSREICIKTVHHSMYTALDTAHYVPHIQKGKAEERERETAVIVAVAHMTVS